MLDTALTDLEISVEPENGRWLILRLLRCLCEASHHLSAAGCALFARSSNRRAELLAIAAVLDLIEVDWAEGDRTLNAVHAIRARVKVSEATAVLSLVHCLHCFCVCCCFLC